MHQAVTSSTAAQVSATIPIYVLWMPRSVRIRASTGMELDARADRKRKALGLRAQNCAQEGLARPVSRADIDAGKAACLTAAEQAMLQAWIAGGQLP